MGMPEGAIGGEGFAILRGVIVIVLVMGIATPVLWTAIAMQQGFMATPVAVLLQQQGC